MVVMRRVRNSEAAVCKGRLEHQPGAVLNFPAGQ